MMKEKKNISAADVGVIIARFQVHNLTDAHSELINTVQNNHNKVVLILGLSHNVCTRNNPLDFEARKQMILELYPAINVLYIKDINDDSIWSAKLDELIEDMLLPGQKAVLYGGRDSFISHYHGAYKTVEFEPGVYISGTESRKEISSKVKSSADFRAGVIWAAHNQYPKVIPTVDIAIYDDRYRFLLVRKPNEKLFRFVGGHAEPNSESYEMDAKREVQEEVGVEISDLEYVGSKFINDWRYRKEVDKIKTIFYKAKYVFGAPIPTGDVFEAKWFTELNEGHVVNEHRDLVKMLKNSIPDNR